MAKGFRTCFQLHQHALENDTGRQRPTSIPFFKAALSTSRPMRPNPAHKKPKSQYVGLAPMHAKEWHTEFTLHGRCQDNTDNPNVIEKDFTTLS